MVEDGQNCPQTHTFSSMLGRGVGFANINLLQPSAARVKGPSGQGDPRVDKCRVRAHDLDLSQTQPRLWSRAQPIGQLLKLSVEPRLRTPGPSIAPTQVFWVSHHNAIGLRVPGRVAPSRWLVNSSKWPTLCVCRPRELQVPRQLRCHGTV